MAATSSSEAFPTVAERRRPTWVMTSHLAATIVEDVLKYMIGSAGQGARGDLGFAIPAVPHVWGLPGFTS